MQLGLIGLGHMGGNIARRLMRAGAGSVVGIDPTKAQLAAAVLRAGGPAYARAAAERLPIATGSVDAVVACLVFEHLVSHLVQIVQKNDE